MFVPDALDFGVYKCRVAEIDRVNISTIDEPFLASTFGGPIEARNDPQGTIIPDLPVFRVRMDGCSPSVVPLVKLKGVVHVNAEVRSSLIEMLRNGYAVVIREIGF